MVGCKRLLKKGLIHSGCLRFAQKWKGSRALILRYHSVQERPDDYANAIGRGIIHSAAAFREQMEWLAQNYEPATMEELAASLRGERPLQARWVAITFDDGYTDNFTIAGPILERLGMRGAFYITVDCVSPHKMPWFCRLRYAFGHTSRQSWDGPFGEQTFRLDDPRQRRQAFLAASGSCARRVGADQQALLERIEGELEVEPLAPAEQLMMNWEQIRELGRRGHVVGAHTMSHPNLTYVTADEMGHEIREAKRRLEENLGSSIRHFSYPSPILQPHWNGDTVECCREAGYQTAVTCTPGTVCSGDAPLSLNRMSAPEDLDEFKWVVQNAFLGRYV